jgi:type II secretory pathway component HofQ
VRVCQFRHSGSGQNAYSSRSIRERQECYHPLMGALALLALCLAAGPARPAPAATPASTRISIDVKDADILDVLRLFGEVGGLQVVADSSVSCKLTLKLKDVEWPQAFELALRACGLGHDFEGGVAWVAPMAKLVAERQERRRLEEERRLSGPLRTEMRRLSYARAQELAPLLKQFLSPRGSVVFDARTNTLFITDIDR